jgi:thioredoxin-dependent peroxiredoxin
MKRLRLALATVLLLAASSAIAADPPAAGERAPAFSLSSQDGAAVTLEQNKGKWVVLYFYPKDFTSGCTVEAHNFQRDLAMYEKADVVILGVSLDTVESHKGFCAKEGLNFKLLADTKADVTKAYGSVMTSGDKQYAARNTFLIDPAGMIRKVYLKVNPTTHSDDVLADLATLKVLK